MLYSHKVSRQLGTVYAQKQSWDTRRQKYLQESELGGKKRHLRVDLRNKKEV